MAFDYKTPRLNVQKKPFCLIKSQNEREKKMEQEEHLNRINSLQNKRVCVQAIDSHNNLTCIQEEVYEDKQHLQNNSSMLSQSQDQQSSGDLKHSFHGESSENNSSINMNTEEDIIFFVPNAMVIQTDIEHHDIFRELMLDLFESIRVPSEGKDKQGNVVKMSFEERRLASFAEFIARIAFLKTIPCPTFNTEYNIQFFSKTLSIKEQSFATIPNTN